MDCNVIKDLIPLHIEKLTSDSSNSLIEEHIKSCEDCRQMINKLQADIISDNEEAIFDKADNLGNNID
jgi:predicted anti-sigma-YlaC factor YlaD